MYSQLSSKVEVRFSEFWDSLQIGGTGGGRGSSTFPSCSMYTYINLLYLLYLAISFAAEVGRLLSSTGIQMSFP